MCNGCIRRSAAAAKRSRSVPESAAPTGPAVPSLPQVPGPFAAAFGTPAEAALPAPTALARVPRTDGDEAVGNSMEALLSRELQAGGPRALRAMGAMRRLLLLASAGPLRSLGNADPMGAPTAAWYSQFETCPVHLEWVDTFGSDDLWTVRPSVSADAAWVDASPLANSHCPTTVVTVDGQVVHFSKPLIRISGLRNKEWQTEPQIWGFDCSGTTTDVGRLAGDLARASVGDRLDPLTCDGAAAATGANISRLQLVTDRKRGNLDRALRVRTLRPAQRAGDAPGDPRLPLRSLPGLNGLTNLVPVPLHWTDRLLATTEMAWGAMQELRGGNSGNGGNNGNSIGTGRGEAAAATAGTPASPTGAASLSARITVFPYSKNLHTNTDCRVSLAVLRPKDPAKRVGPYGGALLHMGYLPHQFATFSSLQHPEESAAAAADVPTVPPTVPLPPGMDSAARPAAVAAVASDALSASRANAQMLLAGASPLPMDLRELLDSPHKRTLDPALARTVLAAPFIAGLLGSRPLGTLKEESERMRAAANAFALGAVDASMIPMPTPPAGETSPEAVRLWAQRTAVFMCARKILWKIIAPECVPESMLSALAAEAPLVRPQQVSADQQYPPVAADTATVPMPPRMPPQVPRQVSADQQYPPVAADTATLPMPPQVPQPAPPTSVHTSPTTEDFSPLSASSASVMVTTDPIYAPKTLHHTQASLAARDRGNQVPHLPTAANSFNNMAPDRSVPSVDTPLSSLDADFLAEAAHDSGWSTSPDLATASGLGLFGGEDDDLYGPQSLAHPMGGLSPLRSW